MRPFEYSLEENYSGGLAGAVHTGDSKSFAGKFLLLIVVLLMCIGIVVVYTSGAGWAQRKFSNQEYFLWRQVIYAVLGLGTVFFFSTIDYRIFRKLSKVFFFASILLLGGLLVFKFLGVIKGAARWIYIGPLSFQVSDFAKYAMIFHFARLITDKKEYIKDLNESYYPMLTLLMMVVSLIAFAPNFSTASLVALIGFSMMFLGGARLKYLLLTAAALVPLAIAFAMSRSYRVDRILSFFNGGDEGQLSYQVRQALIGLGNGGMFGLGIGESKQRELFLPLSYNDFVFVIIGEEFGFVGALVVLLLFALFFICGLVIAKNAADGFGRFVALGITITIVLYALVNIAVASNVLPTTGVALPFISYGGTALLFNSLGVGILVSISRKKKPPAAASSGNEMTEGAV